MTRKEQIEQKAKELGQKYFPDEYNIWARANYEAQYVESACKEMIEWADKNQKDDPLEGILIHGNNDAYRLGYRVAIDKACEWLYKRQQVDLVVPNIEKFIDDFKKDMGEQQ